MNIRLTLTRESDERNAWRVWLSLLAIVSLGICLGSTKSVSVHYSRAAMDWLHGEPLYNFGGSGFLYLPQAAILHVPLALLQRVPGEILWRALTIGIYALGIRRLCGLSERTHAIRLFPLATCVAVPLAFSAARNGQTTLLVAGLMMIAIDDVVQARWGRSAALLSLALALKPVGLPFILLLGALHPAMRWRLLAGAVAVALFPYLTHDWAYVNSQYVAWRESMHAVLELQRTVAFAQVFRVLEIVGWTVSPGMQMAVRLFAAVVLLGLLWRVRRRLPAARYGIYLFTLTTGYVLLLNPRTENNGYSFLSPALGLFLAEAYLVERRWSRGVVLSVIAAGLLGSYELAVLVAPNTPPIWISPLMAIGFLTVAGRCLGREMTRPPDFAVLFDPLEIDFHSPHCGPVSAHSDSRRLAA
jgi:hypothetical protein